VIQIPLLETLLLFTDYISNRASNLFLSHVPLVLPILEMLYYLLCKLKRLSSPQSSPPNVLFFYYLHYSRDILWLAIYRFCDEFLNSIIKEHINADRFIIYYHRDVDLEEYLSLSIHTASSDKEIVSKYFRRFSVIKKKGSYVRKYLMTKSIVIL